MKQRVLTWSLVGVWMIAILSFSVITSIKPSAFIHSVARFSIEFFAVTTDKQLSADFFEQFLYEDAHFFLYMLLGLLTLFAVRRHDWRGWKGVWSSLLICSIFALLNEGLMFCIPIGKASWLDMLLGIGGSCLGISMYMFAAGMMHRG